MEREPINHVRQEIASAMSQVLRKAEQQPILQVVSPMSREVVGQVFKEGSPHQERHLILSDYQIPDYSKKAHSLVLDFIGDYKPTYLHINGDFLNFTPFSRYDVIVGKQPPPIKEELKIGRKILGELVEAVRKQTPEAEVVWLAGNHESRLEKFIIRQALGSHSPLIDLEVDGEEVLSIPHLFKLKELGVEWVPERKSKKIHDFFIEHGDMVRKYAGYTAQGMIDRKGSSGVSSHCFDKETEVLTTQGWKKYNFLKKGQQVMTLNRTTNAMEWNKINEVFKYKHFKEMVKIKTRDVDLLVTKGHGLWVGKNMSWTRSIKWYGTTAEEVMGKRRVFRLAGHQVNGGIPLPECWIRLIAWIVSEGSIGKYRGKFSTIRIAQSDTPKGAFGRLIKVLNECGILYNKSLKYKAGTTKHGQYRNYDAYYFGILKSRNVWNIIKPYITLNKSPKNTLLQMSAEQGRAFLDAYIDADGCKNKDAVNSYQIGTNRIDQLDFLQAVASKSGYRTSVSSHSGMFYLTLNTRLVSRVDKNNWSVIPYKGVAWCASVDNGTLLVRRGGHTMITLNTHRLALVGRTNATKTMYWIESGSMCNSRPTPQYAKDADWQRGFGVMIYDRRKKQVYPTAIPIIKNSFMFGGKLYQ